MGRPYMDSHCAILKREFGRLSEHNETGMSAEPQSNTLQLSREEMREFGYRVIDMLLDYYDERQTPFPGPFPSKLGKGSLAQRDARYFA